jgi:NADH-quinone oxidoreductase subunit C
MTDENSKLPPENAPADNDTSQPKDEAAADATEQAPEPKVEPSVDTPANGDSSKAPPETSTDTSEKPAEAKPVLTEDERSAKIAAAKAKAAAKKAAEADAEPKPPWEEKPIPPERNDAADDSEVVALAEGVEGSVLSAERFAGDLTVTVPPGKIVEICGFLKRERGFSFLVDFTAVDWLEREEGRFDVVYWMHRFDDEFRLRLVTVVAEDQIIESVTGVWKVADWMEREVYDLYGIVFANHPNLERILTWEGFNGHPLRKDFPVEGIDTGAAIYPDVYPPGGGPVVKEEKGDKA